MVVTSVGTAWVRTYVRAFVCVHVLCVCVCVCVCTHIIWKWAVEKLRDEFFLRVHTLRNRRNITGDSNFA